MSKGLLKWLACCLTVALALPGLSVSAALGEDESVAGEGAQGRQLLAVEVALTEHRQPTEPAAPVAPVDGGAGQQPGGPSCYEPLYDSCCVPPCHSGCCNTCCDSCCKPCCTCIAGVEATFLAADFDNDARVLVSNTFPPLETIFSDPTDTLDENLSVGPRVWLGRQCEKYGVVARFWGLEEGDGMEAYTIDLEGTRRFCCGCWHLLGSVGVRYAHVETGGAAAAIAAYPDPAFDPIAAALAYSRSEADGTGLTIGLQGTRPVRCGSSWNYFWNLRGSFLWGGDTSALAYTTATVIAPGAVATQSTAAFADDESANLFIGELQAGLQWEHCLKCIPARAFLRFAFEYQNWSVTDGDVFAEAGSAATVPPTLAAAFASAGDPDLDLYGFTIGTGLTY